MGNCQPGAHYAGASRRVAEADLRHISVSDHPTTDIRETCTYQVFVNQNAGNQLESTLPRFHSVAELIFTGPPVRNFDWRGQTFCSGR